MVDGRASKAGHRLPSGDAKRRRPPGVSSSASLAKALSRSAASPLANSARPTKRVRRLSSASSSSSFSGSDDDDDDEMPRRRPVLSKNRPIALPPPTVLASLCSPVFRSSDLEEEDPVVGAVYRSIFDAALLVAGKLKKDGGGEASKADISAFLTKKFRGEWERRDSLATVSSTEKLLQQIARGGEKNVLKRLVESLSLEGSAAARESLRSQTVRKAISKNIVHCLKQLRSSTSKRALKLFMEWLDEAREQIGANFLIDLRPDHEKGMGSDALMIIVGKISADKSISSVHATALHELLFKRLPEAASDSSSQSVPTLPPTAIIRASSSRGTSVTYRDGGDTSAAAIPKKKTSRLVNPAAHATSEVLPVVRLVRGKRPAPPGLPSSPSRPPPDAKSVKPVRSSPDLNTLGLQLGNLSATGFRSAPKGQSPSGRGKIVVTTKTIPLRSSPAPQLSPSSVAPSTSAARPSRSGKALDAGHGGVHSSAMPLAVRVEPDLEIMSSRNLHDGQAPTGRALDTAVRPSAVKASQQPLSSSSLHSLLPGGNPVRFSHSACLLDKKDMKVTIFGGDSQHRPANDSWKITNALSLGQVVVPAHLQSLPISGDIRLGHVYRVDRDDRIPVTKKTFKFSSAVGGNISYRNFAVDDREFMHNIGWKKKQAAGISRGYLEEADLIFETFSVDEVGSLFSKENVVTDLSASSATELVDRARVMHLSPAPHIVMVIATSLRADIERRRSHLRGEDLLPGRTGRVIYPLPHLLNQTGRKQ